MNMVTKNAQRQATAPASIAVKMPPRMPPRMMTSVIRPPSRVDADLDGVLCRDRLSPRMTFAIGDHEAEDDQ
jgi:hypothetical protein